MVIVGKGHSKPLPNWLKEWLEERSYCIPSNGILNTISEEEFTEALNGTEIYYFGRTNLIQEAV